MSQPTEDAIRHLRTLAEQTHRPHIMAADPDTMSAIDAAVKATPRPAAILINARAPQWLKAAARAESAKHGLELIEE